MDDLDAGAPPALDLEALYRREHSAMVRLAVMLIGSRSVAEEVVHDAFMIVESRWVTLTNPGGYLRGSVVNGCRAALRRREVEARHTPSAALPARLPTELVELRDALDRLREREHCAIVLRYFGDWPEAEIAAALECRPATVRSLVHRGLTQLRKDLT